MIDRHKSVLVFLSCLFVQTYCFSDEQNGALLNNESLKIHKRSAESENPAENKTEEDVENTTTQNNTDNTEPVTLNNVDYDTQTDTNTKQDTPISTGETKITTDGTIQTRISDELADIGSTLSEESTNMPGKRRSDVIFPKGKWFDPKKVVYPKKPAQEDKHGHEKEDGAERTITKKKQKNKNDCTYSPMCIKCFYEMLGLSPDDVDLEQSVLTKLSEMENSNSGRYPNQMDYEKRPQNIPLRYEESEEYTPHKKPRINPKYGYPPYKKYYNYQHGYQPLREDNIPYKFGNKKRGRLGPYRKNMNQELPNEQQPENGFEPAIPPQEIYNYPQIHHRKKVLPSRRPMIPFGLRPNTQDGTYGISPRPAWDSDIPNGRKSLPMYPPQTRLYEAPYMSPKTRADFVPDSKPIQTRKFAGGKNRMDTRPRLTKAHATSEISLSSSELSTESANYVPPTEKTDNEPLFSGENPKERLGNDLGEKRRKDVKPNVLPYKFIDQSEQGSSSETEESNISSTESSSAGHGPIYAPYFNHPGKIPRPIKTNYPHIGYPVKKNFRPRPSFLKYPHKFPGKKDLYQSQSTSEEEPLYPPNYHGRNKKMKPHSLYAPYANNPYNKHRGKENMYEQPLSSSYEDDSSYGSSKWKIPLDGPASHHKKYPMIPGYGEAPTNKKNKLNGPVYAPYFNHPNKMFKDHLQTSQSLSEEEIPYPTGYKPKIRPGDESMYGSSTEDYSYQSSYEGKPHRQRPYYASPNRPSSFGKRPVYAPYFNYPQKFPRPNQEYPYGQREFSEEDLRHPQNSGYPKPGKKAVQKNRLNKKVIPKSGLRSIPVNTQKTDSPPNISRPINEEEGPLPQDLDKAPRRRNPHEYPKHSEIDTDEDYSNSENTEVKQINTEAYRQVTLTPKWYQHKPSPVTPSMDGDTQINNPKKKSKDASYYKRPEQTPQSSEEYPNSPKAVESDENEGGPLKKSNKPPGLYKHKYIPESSDQESVDDSYSFPSSESSYQMYKNSPEFQHDGYNYMKKIPKLVDYEGEYSDVSAESHQMPNKLPTQIYNPKSNEESQIPQTRKSGNRRGMSQKKPNSTEGNISSEGTNPNQRLGSDPSDNTNDKPNVLDEIETKGKILDTSEKQPASKESSNPDLPSVISLRGLDPTPLKIPRVINSNGRPKYPYDIQPNSESTEMSPQIRKFARNPMYNYPYKMRRPGKEHVYDSQSEEDSQPNYENYRPHHPKPYGLVKDESQDYGSTSEGSDITQEMKSGYWNKQRGYNSRGQAAPYIGHQKEFKRPNKGYLPGSGSTSEEDSVYPSSYEEEFYNQKIKVKGLKSLKHRPIISDKYNDPGYLTFHTDHLMNIIQSIRDGECNKHKNKK